LQRCYTQLDDAAVILCACIRDTSSWNHFWDTVFIYRMGFSSFSSSPVNAWVVPRLGHVGFFPSPSQIFIYQSSCNSSLCRYNNRLVGIRHKTASYRLAVVSLFWSWDRVRAGRYGIRFAVKAKFFFTKTARLALQLVQHSF
jgi:hypothetical protein